MKKKTIILAIAVIVLIIFLSITALLITEGTFSQANSVNNQTYPTPSLSPNVQASSSPTPSLTMPTPTAPPTSIPAPSPIPTPNSASIVFSDSFQSGNTNAWTNTSNLGVTLGVKNSMFECSTNGPTLNSWGYVYKWLNQPYTTLDWRWYIYFDNLPTTNGNIIGAGGMYNSAIESNFTTSNDVCSVNVVRQNGACIWRLDYVNNNVLCSISSTSTVAADNWYLIELKAVQGAGNGEVHFYLNAVETLNATGLINNSNSGIDHVSVGGGITADQPISWYCASAVASTQYVGPQQSTPSYEPSLNVQATNTLVEIKALNKTSG